MGEHADVGVIGLAVMGQNLVLNMADHGFTVAVFNRTTATTHEFVSGRAAGAAVIATDTLEQLVEILRRPRRILLMVKAGPAVDAVIGRLVPLLDEGDVLIDGGNSLYTDTIRRAGELESKGLLYVGTGVSGGEEGARHGPSIMPGGSSGAWPAIRDVLQSIAAVAPDGAPCCDWIGPNGSGHYVKMVHNGIEYGDMQVIAEAYALMRATGMPHVEMAAVFRSWSAGDLSSFLIDITADVLEYVDDEGRPLVERILDAAGQKGTGKWTVISAMELGQPVTLVAEAVFARIVSAFKDQRVHAARLLSGPEIAPSVDLDDIRSALHASKIVSYAQGFMLLRAASEEHDWNLDLGRTASLWRAGCIIRATFLEDITAAFDRDPGLASLLLDDGFAESLGKAQAGWRRVVSAAVQAGVPVPAYGSGLAFYDAYRSERLPANLIQAQRDYFGAHTYERVDRPRGEFFHTNWTGRGGETTAGSYQA